MVMLESESNGNVGVSIKILIIMFDVCSQTPTNWY